MPATKKILMACSNYWDSPFQVGSHHLARGFVRAGYQVAFCPIPSPRCTSPGADRDLGDRFRLWRSGGRTDLDGKLWAYVPAALATPHNKPLLRSEMVHRRWHQWTWPNLLPLVRRQGFADVDLLYVDSINQSFWLGSSWASANRFTGWRTTIPHFEKYTACGRQAGSGNGPAGRPGGVSLGKAAGRMRRSWVRDRRRCCPMASISPILGTTGPPRPAEYASLAWANRGLLWRAAGLVSLSWIRAASTALPEMAFVLIGPDGHARGQLAGLANVHLLGMRDYALLPAYLQHAQVG